MSGSIRVMNQSQVIENPKSNSQEHAHAESAIVEDSFEYSIDWREALRIGFVALCAIAVWFRVWEPFSLGWKKCKSIT